MMVRSRLRRIVGAVLAVGTLAAGMGMFVYRTAGARPQDAPAGKTAKAAPPVSRKDDPSRTSERIGRRARRPGRRSVAKRRGRAVHRHRCHRPGDGEMADDLYGARHRTAAPSRRTAATSSPRSIGRNLDPQEAGIWVYDLTGADTSSADLRAEGANRSGRTTAGRSSSVCRSARGIGSSRPGASMPMAQAGPGCRSPMATSSSIAPATARGLRRGPSAANPPIRDGSPWSTPMGPAPAI